MCNCVHYEMTGIAVAAIFMCHVCVMHWTQINTSRVTRWYINYSCYLQMPTSRFGLNDKIKSDWNSSIKLIWIEILCRDAVPFLTARPAKQWNMLPGWLGRLCPWRFSRCGCIKPWTTCSELTLLWTRDFLRPLPTWITLWSWIRTWLCEALCRRVLTLSVIPCPKVVLAAKNVS